ncbi:hypothetical protein TNCV_1921381 [Trichonephila clavipes]|nr:hypothetical protein TNCV_1921381 [Trichonephila clavipes]
MSGVSDARTNGVEEADWSSEASHRMFSSVQFSENTEKEEAWLTPCAPIGCWDVLAQLENRFQKIWILTDSRASIQHLANWVDIGGQTSLDILSVLHDLSSGHSIHFSFAGSLRMLA